MNGVGFAVTSFLFVKENSVGLSWPTIGTSIAVPLTTPISSSSTGREFFKLILPLSSGTRTRSENFPETLERICGFATALGVEVGLTVEVDLGLAIEVGLTMSLDLALEVGLAVMAERENAIAMMTKTLRNCMMKTLLTSLLV